MIYETIEALIETLDHMYDVDGLEFDYKNGNFDLDNWDDELHSYYTPQIVANSVVNGQIIQAKDQIKMYGLSSIDLVGYLSREDLTKLI